jgi:hypothetical protein
MPDISAQDFKDWLNHPCTIIFMDKVELFSKDKDKEVHKFLLNNELDQAAHANAEMTQLNVIIKTAPEIIIEELEEEE